MKNSRLVGGLKHGRQLGAGGAIHASIGQGDVTKRTVTVGQPFREAEYTSLLCLDALGRYHAGRAMRQPAGHEISVRAKNLSLSELDRKRGSLWVQTHIDVNGVADGIGAERPMEEARFFRTRF